MATYHVRLKHGSRASGRSAKSHALYLLREQQYQYRVHELVFVEHGNLPLWARDQPLTFWETADRYERKNGRLYSELEIALPRELTKEQRFRLVQDFVEQTLGNRHPYLLVIHESQALDGKVQPHFHLMFSVRTQDGIEREQSQFFRRANPHEPEQSGARKALDWYEKESLQRIRLQWEEAANLALKRAGHDITIDRRTLQAQGIDRAPEPVLGPYHTMLLKQGVLTERAEQVIALREQRRREQEQAHSQERLIQEYTRLRTEYRSLATAHDSMLVERTRLTNSILTLENYLVHDAPSRWKDAVQMAEQQLWGGATAALAQQVEAARHRVAEIPPHRWQHFHPLRLHHDVQQFFKRQEAKQQLKRAEQQYAAFLRQQATDAMRAKRDALAAQLYGWGKTARHKLVQYQAALERTQGAVEASRERVEQVFDCLMHTVDRLQARGITLDANLNPRFQQQGLVVGQEEYRAEAHRTERGFSR